LITKSRFNKEFILVNKISKIVWHFRATVSKNGSSGINCYDCTKVTDFVTVSKFANEIGLKNKKGKCFHGILKIEFRLIDS